MNTMHAIVTEPSRFIILQIYITIIILIDITNIIINKVNKV